jgi:FtsX-like permease family
MHRSHLETISPCSASRPRSDGSWIRVTRTWIHSSPSLATGFGGAGSPGSLRPREDVFHRGRTFTIAGVTPSGFEGLRPGFAVDVTLPIGRKMESLGGHDIVARLKPGVSDGQAKAESAAVLRAVLSELGFPKNLIEQRFRQVELRPAGRGADTLRGRFAKPLYALVGIAALVLLLAAANIANLLLARGFTRRREFAIRLAAGAGRMRLVRQLVTETLLLFACGAIPGVALARAGVNVIESMFAEGRTRDYDSGGPQLASAGFRSCRNAGCRSARGSVSGVARISQRPRAGDPRRTSPQQ